MMKSAKSMQGMRHPSTTPVQELLRDALRRQSEKSAKVARMMSDRQAAVSKFRQKNKRLEERALNHGHNTLRRSNGIGQAQVPMAGGNE